MRIAIVGIVWAILTPAFSWAAPELDCWIEFSVSESGNSRWFGQGKEFSFAYDLRAAQRDSYYAKSLSLTAATVPNAAFEGTLSVSASNGGLRQRGRPREMEISVVHDSGTRILAGSIVRLPLRYAPLEVVGTSYREGLAEYALHCAPRPYAPSK